jgi:hypothetical protein
VASGLAALRSRSECAGQRVAFVGSIAVIAAGMLERLFFSGGIS